MTEQDIKNQEEKQEKVRTQVVLNNLEMSYAVDLNVQSEYQPEYLFFVECCRKKERKELKEGTVPEIRKEIEFWKNKCPKSKVIHLFQFKKGLKKTKEQIEVTKQGQDVKNADGVCFYEELAAQGTKEFEEQLKEFLKFRPAIEKYVMLEIEAEDIEEKIDFALKKNIKNFVFMGGDYNNYDLWTSLISKIKKEKGKTALLLTKRMHPTTKQSYIKKAIEFGVDYVVHGQSFGGGSEDEEERVILFLDVIDLVYKELKEIKDEDIKNKTKNINDKNILYKISRLLAVDKSNVFAKTHTRKELVQAGDISDFF